MRPKRGKGRVWVSRREKRRKRRAPYSIASFLKEQGADPNWGTWASVDWMEVRRLKAEALSRYAYEQAQKSHSPEP